MEKLGIQPTLLLAQIVNFLIIFFVLSKLLYKPIRGMLDKRKKEIEEGLALTEKMRQEEDKLKVKQNKILDETRREGEAYIDKAKAQAVAESKEILNNANKQAQEIIAKGKEEVKSLHTAMEGDLKTESISLASIMAKKILTNVVSDRDQHKLIEKQLRALEHAKLA